MLLEDGYYYILQMPPPGNTFLYYDTSTGRAKVQNIVGVANILKNTSSIVFRVEAVSDDAFVIYAKENQLALSLQGASGTTISMAALNREDNRQWWKLKSEGIS
jgi:hypothetical protein